MRRFVLAALLALLVPLAPASAAERERFDTRVFAMVQEPGYPAYVFTHRNGRVYAGTYTNPQGDTQRSLVREWSRDGTLLRTWAVPRQNLDEPHGVQVANQDRRGRLVLLEKSTASVQTLDVRTGKFRRWATLPDLPDVEGEPIPNFATWGPGGALYVSDYGQAVIWKITRKKQRPKAWLVSDALAGAAGFGTTGLAYRRNKRDLLITQQSTSDGSGAPTNGKLYRLPIRDNGRPGTLRTLWTSLPSDLPDGFGIGRRTGRIYIANAGLTNQLVVLDRKGEEIERFPEQSGTGENGSSIPFDTPSSATFLGRRVLVANQSFTGNTEHHAILDVYVGERGRPPHLPKRALWR